MSVTPFQVHRSLYVEAPSEESADTPDDTQLSSSHPGGRLRPLRRAVADGDQ